MLMDGVHAGSNFHVHFAVESLSVIRVDQSANRCYVHGPFLRFEPKDAVGLV